jgi:O-succinylbenzoic acid--CoA ligase
MTKRVQCPVAFAAKKTPDVDALMFEGETLSYAQLDSRVRRAVAWLKDEGVGPGDRIGVAAWNCAETVVLFHALQRLGAALVPFNIRLSQAELLPLAAQAACKRVFADDAGRGLVSTSEPFPGWSGREDSAEQNDIEAVAAILFTSGTTGMAKPVPLTGVQFEASARASAENLRAGRVQRWLLCLPLFHVGALALVSRCAFYGATVVLEKAFDAARTSALIDAGAVTHASLVATALRRLVVERGSRPVPPSLCAVLVGGGPLPSALWQDARHLGIPVLQTYGLTEACSQVATERPGEADGRTAGLPLPGIEVMIMRNDGPAHAQGEVGEIQVRGPTVCGNPEWLHTGDLGSLDERGRLTVYARRSDLIISGGENVYPVEIERVLEGHPSVVEAAVMALPDDQWGQVPVAAVVARDASLTEGALKEWLAPKLGRYKQPRSYRFVSALPRNANGKLVRSELLAQWQPLGRQ